MALLRSALLGHSTVEVQNDIVSDDSMVCEAQLGYDGLPAKDAKAIQDDFRSCKHEIAHCDAMTESLASAPESTKSEKLFKHRQLAAISKKRSTKMEHLKRLNARLKALHEHSKAGNIDVNQPVYHQPTVSRNENDKATTVASPPATTSLTSPTASCSTAVTIEAIPDHSASADHQSKTTVFHVDRTRITALTNEEQGVELQQLGLSAVYNQEQFEQGVLQQVDEALAAEDELRLNRDLQKEMTAIQDDIKSCEEEIKLCDDVIDSIPTHGGASRETQRRVHAVNRKRENKEQHLKRMRARQKALYDRMVKSVQQFDPGDSGSSSLASPRSDVTDLLASPAPSVCTDASGGGVAAIAESDAERKIRLGEMTPFGTTMRPPTMTSTQPQRQQRVPHQRVTSQRQQRQEQVSSFGQCLLDQNGVAAAHAEARRPSKSRDHQRRSSRDSEATVASSVASNSKPVTKSRGDSNFFDSHDKTVYKPAEKDFSNYKTKKRRLHAPLKHNFTGDRAGSDIEIGHEVDEDEYENEGKDASYEPPSDLLYDSDYEAPAPKRRQKTRRSAAADAQDDDACADVDLGELKAQCGVKRKGARSSGAAAVSYSRGAANRDDGSKKLYVKRIKHHVTFLFRRWRDERLRAKHERLMRGVDGADAGGSSDESDVDIDDAGRCRVPARIWHALYRYQRTGVRWLWELHTQQCGGIVGDEMGLGKTIQVIAFLAALRQSKQCDAKSAGLGPVLIVSPITVMHQWVREFHKWWPPFRVAVLHGSGSYTGSEKRLIREMALESGVLVTSYSHVVTQLDTLLQYDWQYVVLDEGHKIRNPDAQVTLAVKQFRTCHRLILSGSPMQNNLKELWSLFDFVFPGKLGTLPDFMAHFSVPITAGGYANASQVQVTTAYKCACVLRDTINPYLLRRMKSDVSVSLDLPGKNEQVLFCRLTQLQRDVYREYLDSKQCEQILAGKYMVFPGLITLRKICNHPDLCTGGAPIYDAENDVSEECKEYGHHSRSGKMIVVESLLKIWKKQGHRVLLFTQGTQMMTLLERFVVSRGYRYLRMDGQTSISSRQPMVNTFNQDESIFLFLLTTRVGGLGVNLTGADRVVIFDPDWNPSTDTQARERAWRIGQQRHVTIYRLITAGTIEEKIYHRQIFKQFLTNRVLKDPKQRRFFKANDLYELFTLGNDDVGVGTETSAIFAGTGSDVKVKKIKSSSSSRSREKKRRNRFDAMCSEKTSSADDCGTRADPDPDLDLNGSDDLDWDKEKLDHIKSLATDLSKTVADEENQTTTDQKIASNCINTPAENATTQDTQDTVESKKFDKNCADAVAMDKTVGSATTAGGGCTADPEDGEITCDNSSPIVNDEQCKNTEPTEVSDNVNRVSDNVSLTQIKDHNSKERAAVVEPDSSKHKSKSDKTDKNRQHKQHLGKSDKHHEKRDKHRHKHPEKPDKHRRHKKHRKRDAKFEGERVPHLQRQSSYTRDDAAETVPNSDEYVLSRLFSKSGVHSAIQHDSIMQSGEPDYALVEGEAQRVAQEAARALKASRAACYNATSGKPTWTGTSGVRPRFGQKKSSNLLSLKQKVAEKQPTSSKSRSAPAAALFAPDPVKARPQQPPPQLFDGSRAGNVLRNVSAANSKNVTMTSADLLRRMRERNFGNNTLDAAPQNHGDAASADLNSAAVTTSQQQAAAAVVTSPSDAADLELMTDVRNFVAFGARVDGRAETHELMGEFRERLPPEESAKFKAMLKQLCTLHRHDGIGVWHLKPEFR